MSLRDWLANRWIVAHSPSAQEIADLFAIVDRDLTDAATPRLSDDWRLGITYNAALQLATIALAAESYTAAVVSSLSYGISTKSLSSRIGQSAFAIPPLA